MADSQSAPLPADPPQDLLAQREAELARVAKTGQERIAKEQALQLSIEQKRIDEEKRAKKASEDLETGRKEKHASAQKFRTVRMTNEKEIAADKERERKLEEQQELQKKKHQEELKKQDSYFHLLREAAGLKIAKEHHENALKREAEAERKKAGLALNAALAAAVETERLAGQEIEQEVRARKSLIDIDTRAALYRFEADERMHLHELDSEMHRRLSEIQQQEKTAYEQQRKKASLELLMRSKRRHVDAEMAGKKQAIEFEDRRKRALIDTEAQERHVDAARERQHAIHRAEQIYSERLNEIGREYITKHYDHRP